jgi:hypothetical protein
MLITSEPGEYACVSESGEHAACTVEPLPQASTVEGAWDVQFQKNRGAPEQIRFETLTDWSKHFEKGIQHFSGTATYRKAIQVPPNLLGPGKRLFLDLGSVQVMAQVRLNGKDLGVVWAAPFRLDISDIARPGENELQITVANLWPNRLIGDQGLPQEERITWTTWNPFDAVTPLLPSGLLGPVTLRPVVERQMRLRR